MNLASDIGNMEMFSGGCMYRFNTSEGNLCTVATLCMLRRRHVLPAAVGFSVTAMYIDRELPIDAGGFWIPLLPLTISGLRKCPTRSRSNSNPFQDKS